MNAKSEETCETGTHPEQRAASIRARVLVEQAALNGCKGHNPVVDAQAFRETADWPSQQRKAGKRCHDRLVNLAFQVDDHELLAGRILSPSHTPRELEEAEEVLSSRPPCGGQTGHCEVATDELFHLGVDGLIARITELQHQNTGDTADVYHAFVDALTGFSSMIENAARPLDNALPHASPARQAELRDMLESCRRIAHDPPQTFRDALQLTWFVQLGTMLGDHVGLVCSGRIDRRLNSYYEADMASGRLTHDRARELIEGLYFLTNATSGAGAAFAVMVGGRDADGKDVTNELSHICLEALRRTNLVYPTVGVCWHENTPEALTDLATDLVARGYSTPAFFNDAVIQRGLHHYGVPSAESCDYLNSTCVEISTCGSSNIWVASPYFSLCHILMEYMDTCVSEAHSSLTYDTFLDGYFARLGDDIAAAVAAENEKREQRRLHGRKPLQSVFTHDCIERGRDIDDGGARYNWVECSFVGLANLVDSLQVIRTQIFDTDALGFAELKQILDTNFEGREAERQRFLNKHPKYGQGDERIDATVTQVMDVIKAECAKYKMLPDDSHFVPGTFCWVMHQRLGEQCGATPDGRRAGFPFADGAGPAQGRETLGPTAAIRSVTSWDHTPMIGGSAFNMKFTASLFDSPTAQVKLKQLVLTFLREGGFETQINVTDNRLLHEAREHPEGYQDLVVRIGGYTDYFTRLSPQMQDEVLMRTEYSEL